MARVAGVIMVALMLMTVANIVGRTWFQLPQLVLFLPQAMN